ncbi:MAG: methyltransferase domain-containing protein [Candidatus Magasanikbacteria bacterium]|nr:methyltransferase domain-containing protein [Candidatus Magasanikbacteria bacterium]
MKNNTKISGWGVITESGSEIWHSEPVFPNSKITLKEKAKLLFYPKRFFLYNFLKKNLAGKKYKVNILDVGCATGSSIIDFNSMFGDSANLFGVDVVKMQTDIAKQNLKNKKISADIKLYNGSKLPFEDRIIDGIYTSDVLGHVENVDKWLADLNRILVSGGVLAMFSESKLGKHAFVRNRLMKKGVNIDPHSKFHISLYSKDELKQKIEKAGFEILEVRSSSALHFFINPNEFYNALKNKKGFFFLKQISRLLTSVKIKTHPYSTAFLEFYSFLEMLIIGKKVEAQGYIILAKKK